MGISAHVDETDEPRSATSLARTAVEGLGSTAWLVAVPCVVLTVALVFFLGPPLSHVLYPDKQPFTFLPTVIVLPEPIEGTRYLLSLIGPVLLIAGIVLASRRPLLALGGARAAAGLVQLIAAGVVVACFVRQHERGWEIAFFTTWQLVAAVPIAAALAFAAWRGWLTGCRPEPWALRMLVGAFAFLIAGAWFLSFVNTDQSIWALGDPYNTGFQFDEPAAVINGFTPFVDFTSAYGSVWAFVIAPFLWLFGETLLAFTIIMWVLTLVTMVAIYGVLRRVTRSSLAAVSLYLPIMALTFFGAVREVHRPLAIFQEVPLRNVGPFLVAWLVARHLDRASRAMWPLFVAAGLATLNNFEFGIASLGGTLAALLWTSVPVSRERLRRIAAHAAIGVLGAYGLLAAVTLIRAGALPNPIKTLEWDRVYGIGGLGLNRMPHIVGLPLVIYLTYTAALGLATVRAVRQEPNRVLTGMLAWSAIFGFGSGVYFVGESSPKGIPTAFPPWSFTIALLTVAAVQALAARPRRAPSLATLAALLGFALVATFVLDPPASIRPWKQIAAIQHPHLSTELLQLREVGTPYIAPGDPEFASFIGFQLEPGQGPPLERGKAIALFWSTGHVIAEAYGVKDVVPYVPESVFTPEHLDEALTRLRAAGGSMVFMPTLIVDRVTKALSDRGFLVLTQSGYRVGVPGQTIDPSELIIRHGLTKWVDKRAAPAGAAASG